MNRSRSPSRVSEWLIAAFEAYVSSGCLARVHVWTGN
jgi:hypothetical protein